MVMYDETEDDAVEMQKCLELMTCVTGLGQPSLYLNFVTNLSAFAFVITAA